MGFASRYLVFGMGFLLGNCRVWPKGQRYRHKVLALLLGLASLSTGSEAQGVGELPPVYQLDGAKWFDGEGFQVATFYTTHGCLTQDRPARVDSVIDISGGYVVPPFGEAHNHNVETSARIDRYLDDGIYYVKDPNNLPDRRTALRAMLNRPLSIDVTFANGGLTSTGGHPIGIVERSLGADNGEGRFYHTVNNLNELETKWPLILTQYPDFIKVYLLYSEEYDQRQIDSSYVYWRGLDPDLVPEIVRRAHDVGLRVSAHIETAADFRTALEAGVDEINHMPGFRGNAQRGGLPSAQPYTLTVADAKRAARQGTVVVTTLGGVAALPQESPIRVAADALHAHNLRLLYEHGVRIAIGSDSYEETAVQEVLYLHQLGVLDNLALLKAWSETTPATIFPERRIGHLREGYEASFLVLRGDPLEDFGAVNNIVLRVKDGRIIRAE